MFIVHSPASEVNGILKLSTLNIPVLSENVSSTLTSFPESSKISTDSKALLPVLPIINSFSPALYS